MVEKIKSLGKNTKIAILAGAIALIIAIICIAVFAPSGETEIDVEVSLKEVLKTSELYTSECMYNSIVKVPIDSEKPAEDKNLRYCVSYKGKAKYGFDFNKITTVQNDDSLIVIIPKIDIMNVNVASDLDYIFTKKKYDTENTYAEAKELCRQDLKQKAKENKTFYNKAVESAIETVEALTKPFEEQLEEGKTIQVVYCENYVPEVK